jgi:hypothetical protein
MCKKNILIMISSRLQHTATGEEMFETHIVICNYVGRSRISSIIMLFSTTVSCSKSISYFYDFYPHMRDGKDGDDHDARGHCR